MIRSGGRQAGALMVVAAVFFIGAVIALLGYPTGITRH
jgi:hypothetical protein